MTQAEKLEALVQKAIDGGWECFGLIPMMNSVHKGVWEVEYEEPDLRLYFRNLGRTRLYDSNGLKVDENSIIFNHAFARALFGEKLVDHQEVDNDGNAWNFSTLAYQYYPMQAVISTDPISYMYKAVLGETS